MADSKIHELHQLKQWPFGRARTAATEQVVAKIEQEGPEHELPIALLNLVEAYEFSDNGRKSIVAFAKILRLWDTKPELFDSDDEQLMFWQYKWIADAVYLYPEVTLEQGKAFLDDMYRRFNAAAKGVRAPLVAKFAWVSATGCGDLEAARLAWASSPSDEYDDCAACQVGMQVIHYASRKEWQRVLDVAATMREGCNIEPVNTHHACMLAAMQLGDVKAATKYFELAITGLEDSLSGDGFKGIRATMLEALALGGADRTFRQHLVERDSEHLRGLTEKLSDLRFAQSLLTSLVLLGGNGENSETRTGFSEPEWETYGKLFNYLNEFVEKLSKRFDDRNGNNRYTERYRKSLQVKQVDAKLDDDYLYNYGRALKTGSATPASAPASGSAESLHADAASGSADAARVDHAGTAPTDSAAVSTPAEDAPATAAPNGAAAVGAGSHAQAAGSTPAPAVSECDQALLHAERLSIELKGQPIAVKNAYLKGAELALHENRLDRAGAAYAEAAQWAVIAGESDVASTLFAKSIDFLSAGGGSMTMQAMIMQAWQQLSSNLSDIALYQKYNDRLLAQLTEALEQEMLLRRSGYTHTDLMAIREAGRTAELIPGASDDAKLIGKAAFTDYSEAFKRLTGKYWDG